MSKKEPYLNLFQAPMNFGMSIIEILINVEEKYGIEIKDVEVEELIGDTFDIYDIKWKRSYIEEFRDNTSSDDWRDWANQWLDKNK